MSFSAMSAKELREVAEMFGLEVAGMNKQTIIGSLADEGITYEAYEAFASAEKVKPEDAGFATANDEPTGPLMLVKMERQNPSYEIKCPSRVYTFTTRHPFVAVEEADADFIFDTESGFRLATPKEIKQYYG